MKSLKDHNYNGIDATIVADSKNEQGDRIITFVVTFPRIVLAEFNTHRMFSRNSASSRAIPFEKMLDKVQNHPFIPIAFQKDHKGMQGTEYLTPDNEKKSGILKFRSDHDTAKTAWLMARDKAVNTAFSLNTHGVTKQLCNRLLEPFMWHTVIVTATEYENFFKLRCPQYFSQFRSWQDYVQYEIEAGTSPLITASMEHETELLFKLKANTGGAEIHISMLAEKMWDLYNENKPTLLKAGEWHIPFGDKFSIADIEDKIVHKDPRFVEITHNSFERKEHPLTTEAKIKIATARCARISYNNFEGKDDYEADLKLHDRLAKNGHASPFEHCAKTMTHADFYPNAYGGYSRNFKGFIQYREIVES